MPRTFVRAFAAVSLILVALLAHGEEPAMIWVAEGEHNTVYLLGSIHLLREQDHPLPAVVETVYEDAERLVMELDMDDIDAAGALQFVVQNGLLEDDTTLEEQLGPELWAQASASAAEIDIPLAMLSKSEPWLAAMTVQEMLMMRIGFKPEYGIEMYLTNKAVEDGKPVTGLETVNQQLGFLDQLSDDTQKLWFVQSLVEGRRMEMLIDEIVVAWRSGDVAYLEKELLHEMAAYPELHESILVARNRDWLAPIMALLDEDDDYLVVVGAAHLVGEDGVPNLLSFEGVRIKQLHDSVR